MPVVIADNEMRTNPSSAFRGKKFKYNYPEGLDLTPGSDLHEIIISRVMTRAQESYNTMSCRYPAWAEIDKVCTAYIPVDAKEQIVKNKDSRKPVSIVIPQSYATLEILLTYLSAALLEDPMFRYEGQGPEDIVGAILLEKLVNFQCSYSNVLLNLHTSLRDSLMYGFGAATPSWYEEWGYVAKKIPKIPTFFDKFLGREPGFSKENTEEMLFEGNRVDHIDPYLALPDPNVSIDKVRDGEYFGFVNRTNYSALLREERQKRYFNVKYLNEYKGTAGISRLYKTDSSGRKTRSGMPDRVSTGNTTTSPIDVIPMYIDLIPHDWKLPGGNGNKKGDYPETWLFEVAADIVVINAQRLELNHGRKPIVTFSPDFDGYSIAPISKLEMVHGMQEVINFLFNSHITNVRKAINDMLIVDPSLIDMRSLEDPEPGKLIKIRRRAWGRGVDNAVKQLIVNDITKGNMQDAGLLVELIKNMSGAVDAVSGSRRQTSERVTAAEVQGDRFGATSRLEKMARVCSWMGMKDLAYMLASQTQQFMSQESYVKITGTWKELLEKEYGPLPGGRLQVSPFDLLIAYDVMPKDGTIPGGNFSQIWVQMLPMITQNAEASQKLDVVRILKHIMRDAGARDIDQFDRAQGQQLGNQPPGGMQVTPDQQVLDQVQAGNLLPVTGAEGE